MENLIEISNLTFSRSGRVIYDDISLQIKKGKTTAIMGPSGIGKTTMLRLMGGQLVPDKGDIKFKGESIPKMRRNRLFEVRRQMSMLFQSGALFNDLSVFENVAFPLREHTQLDEKLLTTLVLMKLNAVGLRGAKDLHPSQLSGGMARRVALARAIVLDPEMVMYDEPFTGQDPISMNVLLKLVKQLNDTLGLTSIIVSHDVNEVLSIADNVYIFAEQKIIAQGSVEQVLAQKNNALLQQFLAGDVQGPVPFHMPAEDYQADLEKANR